jgi:hypothetical protein
MWGGQGWAPGRVGDAVGIVSGGEGFVPWRSFGDAADEGVPLVAVGDLMGQVGTEGGVEFAGDGGDLFGSEEGGEHDVAVLFHGIKERVGGGVVHGEDDKGSHVERAN